MSTEKELKAAIDDEETDKAMLDLDMELMTPGSGVDGIHCVGVTDVHDTSSCGSKNDGVSTMDVNDADNAGVIVEGVYDDKGSKVIIYFAWNNKVSMCPSFYFIFEFFMAKHGDDAGAKDRQQASTPLAFYFRKNIRMFNAGVAMAFLQVNDTTVYDRRNVLAFKVSGELQRLVGPVTARPGSAIYNCVQTYFLDPAYQDSYRSTRYNGSLRGSSSDRCERKEVEIFAILRQVLTAHNTYLHSFVNVMDYIRQNNLDVKEVKIELHATDHPVEGMHQGRLNLPTAPEISLLMPSNMPMNSQRTIVCNTVQSESGNDLVFFQDYHRSYSPLMYPVLLPFGTDGWTLGLRSRGTSQKHVTLPQYVRYHMMTRPMRINHMHLANKLYQQWIVDQWGIEENKRMEWFKHNQHTIRADLYRGVEDSLRSGEIENSGRSTILASSFTQGNRWYNNRFKNAMAIVRKRGKPDFFITMTMDINCPEVKACLKPGQTPYDRPDIVCRVFQLKRDKLIKAIKSEGIFGKCKATVGVIEFQKRGAPHLHLMIWLEDFDPTPENIDNIICAEFPRDPSATQRKKEFSEDDKKAQEFHDLVKDRMVHGPCGPQFNRGHYWCIQGGKCSKDYPKKLHPNTGIGDDSYPDYRRRSPEDGGNVAVKWISGTKYTLDNRWVVPYNPYLLNRFKCHINVEYCHSVKCIQYMFRYQFKGEDLITVEGISEFDEIALYTVRRYISACQGCFRFLEFPIAKMNPAVEQLPVHLPGEQPVQYPPTREGAEEALHRNAITPLIGYFLANRDTSPLCHLIQDTKYEDMPEVSVWNKERHIWSERKKGQCVGRMVSIHPNSNETFYLRLLLKHVAGAKSYADLRTTTPAGRPHHTFKDACIALNLCESDNEWIECMSEAVPMTTPNGLRTLFCNILLNCDPTEPCKILEQFGDDMSADFLYHRGSDALLSDEVRKLLSLNDMLLSMRKILRRHGKTNANFGITEPTEDNRENFNSEAEVDDGAEDYFDSNFGTLTGEQRAIFDKMTGHIDKNEGGLYNLDAFGGSGKTFLSNILLASARKQRKIAIACAMSGIAATLLRLGTTFHRRFAAPIPCNPDSCSKLKLNSNEARIIKEACLIMIDEVSMMDYKLLDMLDRFLKELMQCDKFMGGKLIILMHDFRQILPVATGGNRGSIVNAAVTTSDVWNHFTQLTLTKNMRVERMLRLNPSPQKRERLLEHARWLLSVGDGTVPSVIPNTNIIEIPDRMV
ncbi:hypothetical protein ACHAWF_019019, partial [Thalassiosira exigua]